MKQLLSIKINAKPMPSPRPRLGRGGTFMPKKYTAHKKEIQGYFTGFKMLPFEKITIEIKLTFTKAKSASNNKYHFP